MTPFHEKVVPLHAEGPDRERPGHAGARPPPAARPARAGSPAQGRRSGDVVPIDQRAPRPARAVGPSLRAGRGRDRRRRPTGQPAAALDRPTGLRRPRTARPAGRPRRRAAGRSGTRPGRSDHRWSGCAPASSRVTRPRSARTCATAHRSRALALRFEVATAGSAWRSSLRDQRRGASRGQAG